MGLCMMPDACCRDVLCRWYLRKMNEFDLWFRLMRYPYVLANAFYVVEVVLIALQAVQTDQISCVVGCETGVQRTLAVHGRLVGLPSGWILLLSLQRGLGRAKPTSVRPNEDHNCMLGTLLSLCTMVLAQHLQARGLLFKGRFNRPSCLSAGCTVQRLPARCLVGLQDL